MTASVWGTHSAFVGDGRGSIRVVRGSEEKILVCFLWGFRFLDDKGMGGEENGDLLWLLAEIWWLWDVR